MLKFDQVQNNFEVFFVEINLRKKKWLLSRSYNPNRKSIVNHVKNISTGLDQFSATYDNLVLISDFKFYFTHYSCVVDILFNAGL